MGSKIEDMESNFEKYERGELHPVTVEFSSIMTAELIANEHKGDWSEWRDVKEMLYELEWHKAKLWHAVMRNDVSDVMEHIADCANILMFLGNAFGIYEKAKQEAIDKGWFNISPNGE